MATLTELVTEKCSIELYTDLFNKRIRIDNFNGEANEVLERINQNTPGWAEKMILKCRKAELLFFLDNGFHQEAFVKGYFNGEDMYFITKYFTEERKNNPKLNDEKGLIESLLKEEKSHEPINTENVLLATEADADELTQLYSNIFKFYPTPIAEPGYVLKTMREGTIYVLIREQNKIVSAASAEALPKFANAELTDCATLPEAQGKGHIKKLLTRLEQVLTDKGIHCLYTIARAESYSMNMVFHQLQYSYGGLMTNNCYIFSGLEDMNVWYKYS